MPQTSFDNYALSYDEHFTRSLIGKAQREIVHAYLATQLCPEDVVLEVNCGTGEDALFISKQVNKIVATDASGGMIGIANSKKNRSDNCVFKQQPIQMIKAGENQPFTKVFSDFGGLNCLHPDELKQFSKTCYEISKEKSDLIFVIMGRKCLWERFYFFLKGEKFKAVRRRSMNGVETEISGDKFLTWYYSPNEIATYFESHFDVIRIRPIGIFIPPSYLETFFARHKLLFSSLRLFEKIAARFSFISDHADHYLIHLKKK